MPHDTSVGHNFLTALRAAGMTDEDMQKVADSPTAAKSIVQHIAGMRLTSTITKQKQKELELFLSNKAGASA